MGTPANNSFRDTIVRECLRQLGEQFRTKDLSEHALMTAGHPIEAADRQYHASVGRYLSKECPHVTRLVAPYSKKRGELWRNHLVQSPSPPPTPAPRALESETYSPPARGSIELGPQNTGDPPFTARMRRHQSWYRAAVLQLAAGTGPSKNSTRVLGNMLPADAARRGSNFLRPAIHEVALARLREGGGNVERYRLLHNMLSSQPMCFNLFAPLVRDPALATRLHAHGALMLVHHPLDRSCERNVAGYRELLVDADASVLSISLDRLRHRGRPAARLDATPVDRLERAAG